MLIILDLVLHKRQVYRHLLFNTFGILPKKSLSPVALFSPSLPNSTNNPRIKNELPISASSPQLSQLRANEPNTNRDRRRRRGWMFAKLIVAYILCDSYLRWARLNLYFDPPFIPCNTTDVEIPTDLFTYPLTNQSLVYSQPNYTSLNFSFTSQTNWPNWTSTTFLYNNTYNISAATLTIPFSQLYTALINSFFFNFKEKPPYEWYLSILVLTCFNLVIYILAFVLVTGIVMRSFQRTRDVIITVLLSTFGKLFTVIMMIWNYDIWVFGGGVDVFVLTSNITACKVLLDLSDGGALLYLVAANGIRVGILFLFKRFNIIPNELLPTHSLYY